MTNEPTQFECRGCTNDAGGFLFCDFCEGQYAHEKCFRAHDCGGHDPEIVFCVCCNAECEISKGKLGHETRPALIGGDPVCAKCAYFKPWEIKPLSHFEKAV